MGLRTWLVSLRAWPVGLRAWPVGLQAWLAARRPPAEVRARLDRDEHVLAWGRSDAGEPVVATRHGLWLPGADGPRRVGWAQVNKAAWDGGALRVTESEQVAPGVVVDKPSYLLRLAEPAGLPAAIQERVTASVAYSEHYELPGHGGVRVVGRRTPGRDGVAYVVRFDDGTDRHDPDVAAAVEQLVARARETPS